MDSTNDVAAGEKWKKDFQNFYNEIGHNGCNNSIRSKNTLILQLQTKYVKTTRILWFEVGFVQLSPVCR